MNLEQLREAHSQKVQEARQLVEQAENGNLNEEGQAKFDGLMQEADSYKKQIANGEKLEAYDRWAKESAGRKTNPREPQAEPIHEDIKQYSLLRAVNRMAENKPVDGLEGEVSQELEKQYGRSPRGMFVPPTLPVTQRYDVTATTAAGVVETITSGEFIDILRARMMLNQLGATFLTNMRGDFEIPKKTATSSVTWFDNEAGDASESSPTIGQVAFSPTSVGTYVDVTRKFIKQSSRDAEQLFRQDLVDTLAHGLDAAALSGSGVGAEPQGLEGNSNITAVALGANGAAPTWAMMVNLESTVDNNNALLGGKAYNYVTTPSGLGKLKNTEKSSSTARYLVENGQSNGYNVWSTNGLSSNLTKNCGSNLSSIIFGNFADLIVASWGGIDILVDPYTQSPSLRIKAYHDVDIDIRHAESFARCVDMVTS